MLLVIDVNKGIQTQTAECLVGEITPNNLLIVLNKTDMIPESYLPRSDEMSRRILSTMKTTKFKDVHIISIAARPWDQMMCLRADHHRSDKCRDV